MEGEIDYSFGTVDQELAQVKSHEEGTGTTTQALVRKWYPWSTVGGALHPRGPREEQVEGLEEGSKHENAHDSEYQDARCKLSGFRNTKAPNTVAAHGFGWGSCWRLSSGVNKSSGVYRGPGKLLPRCAGRAGMIRQPRRTGACEHLTLPRDLSPQTPVKSFPAHLLRRQAVTTEEQ